MHYREIPLIRVPEIHIYMIVMQSQRCLERARQHNHITDRNGKPTQLIRNSLFTVMEQEFGSTSTSTTYNTQTINISAADMISIPSRAFDDITSSEAGVLFSLYSDNALFPIRINQTVSENSTYKAIGSPVIAASIAGHNISNLVETVNITLSILLSVSPLNVMLIILVPLTI